MDQRKIRVAVIFGGQGPEHSVSCLGAGNTLGAIDRDRYEVIPIGITTDGTWVPVPDRPERLALTGGELPSVESAAAEPATAGRASEGAAGAVFPTSDAGATKERGGKAAPPAALREPENTASQSGPKRAASTARIASSGAGRCPVISSTCGPACWTRNSNPLTTVSPARAAAAASGVGHGW